MTVAGTSWLIKTHYLCETAQTDRTGHYCNEDLILKVCRNDTHAAYQRPGIVSSCKSSQMLLVTRWVWGFRNECIQSQWLFCGQLVGTLTLSMSTKTNPSLLPAYIWCLFVSCHSLPKTTFYIHWIPCLAIHYTDLTCLLSGCFYNWENMEQSNLMEPM